MKTVARAAGWSVIAKGIAALNLVLALPFVYQKLPATEFGLWATLVATVNLLGFLDFGIGNGAMNLVASAAGRSDTSEVRAVLREATIVLGRVGIAIGLCAIASAALPWAKLFHLSASLAGVAAASVCVTLVVVALTVPFSLGTRGLLGLGRGDTVFRWQAAGQIASILATVAAALLRASLPVLIFATMLSVLLPAAANWLTLRHDSVYGWSKSKAHTPDLSLRRLLFRDGSQFFVIQIAIALTFAIDLPLIAALRGSAAVGMYAICQRLFGVIAMVLSIVWTPMWPILRQAIAAGDVRWTLATARLALLIAVGVAIAGSCIFFIGFDALTHLWMGRHIDASLLLLAGLAVWTILEAGGQAFSMLLNAAGVLRLQAMTSVALAIVSLGLKTAALTMYGSDLVPWATTLAYVITTAIPFAVLGPALIRRAISATQGNESNAARTPAVSSGEQTRGNTKTR